MDYKMTETGDRITIALSGNLYVESVAVLRGDVLQAIDQGKINFIFDMNRLEYIDSAGLGVLINVQKRVRQRGGEVVIRGLKGEVRELFELTRLDKVFNIKKESAINGSNS